jgi:hypothetical protein
VDQGVDCGDKGGLEEAQAPVHIPVPAQGPVWVVVADGCPVSGFFEKSRRVGGYIDYTS